MDANVPVPEVKPKVSFGFGVAVVILGAGIFLWFQFKPAIKKLLGLDGAVKGVNDQIDKAQLSFNEAQFSIFVSQLKAAMEGLGTDCATVYSVLSQMKNTSDWYELVKMFGTPNNQNLIEWLQDETRLSNSKIQDILGKIGITYYSTDYSNAIGKLINRF